MKRSIVSLTLVVMLILTLTPATSLAVQIPSLELLKETPHFKIYGTAQENEALDDLSAAIERAYDRVTSDLGVTMSKKTRVEIYPDLVSYHWAIGMPSQPDWSVGSGWKNKLVMVSPLNPGPAHDYDSLMLTAVHEFVHVVTYELFPDEQTFWRRPKYLSEGIAAYEAGQSINAFVTIPKDAANGNLPSLADLEYISGAGDYKGYNVYTYGYAYIDFIKQNFGIGKAVSLLKGEPRERVLGVSDASLEPMWIRFLKTAYLSSARLPVQRITDDFVFCCKDTDTGAIESIADALNKVNEALNWRDRGIVVNIYPDIVTLHANFGWQDADDSYVAAYTYDRNQLHMVNPQNPGTVYDQQGILEIAVFHYVVGSIHELHPDIPSYIRSGVAKYEQGSLNGGSDELKNELLGLSRKAFQTSLSELNSLDERIYETTLLGAAFVDFVTEGYGFNVVLKLLEGESLSKATGADDKELEQQWQEYLRSLDASTRLVPQLETSLITTDSCRVAVGLTADGSNTTQKAKDLFVQPQVGSIVIEPTGNESDTNLVSTSSRVVLLDKEGHLRDSVILVVSGDVTGSGTTTLTDLIKIAGALNGSKPLDLWWAMAADMNHSGGIDLSDIVLSAKAMRAYQAGNTTDIE